MIIARPACPARPSCTSALALVVAFALAACGGGSGGTIAHVAPSVPAGSTSASATHGTLTIVFPKNYHVARSTMRTAANVGARAASTRRAPAYVNPTSGDNLLISVNGQPPSTTPIAPVDGSQTVSFPLLAGTYGPGAITVQETDGMGDLLAYGTNTTGATVTAGTSGPAFAITLSMYAHAIAITSDPVAGSDAQLALGGVFCLPTGRTQVFAYAADGSGGFLTPGTGAGSPGSDQNGVPSVPLATLTSAASLETNGAAGGSSTLNATPLGFVFGADGANDGVSANFSVPNPAAALLTDVPTTATGGASIFPKADSTCDTIYASDGANNDVSGLLGIGLPQPTTYGAQSTAASPNGVAVDANGYVYVAASGKISVFTPQLASVAATISDPSLNNDPDGIAVDAQGHIYVESVNNGAITVYAPYTSGQSTPIATINDPTDVFDSNGIAVDASGQIYVTTKPSGQAEIAVFPPYTSGSQTPTYVMQLQNIGFASALALDAAGDVYVTDTIDDQVAMFPPITSSGSEAPQTSFAAGSSNGIAVDAQNRVVLSVNNTIELLAPINTSHGSITPTVLGTYTAPGGPFTAALQGVAVR